MGVIDISVYMCHGKFWFNLSRINRIKSYVVCIRQNFVDVIEISTKINGIWIYEKSSQIMQTKSFVNQLKRNNNMKKYFGPF